MASYPTGVYSPSAKSNGQTIQASFFNDPDAEITAVENALLNGLSHALTTPSLTVSSQATLGPVSAGASTVATLSVSGGSTFAGPAVFSSGLTTTDLTITGTFTDARKPVARVFNSTLTGINNNTWTGLNFDSQRVNSTGMHSTSANSSRISLTSSGVWLVGCNVEFGANNQSARFVRILVDDSTATSIAEMTHWNTNGNEDVCHLNTVYYSNSTTHYVTVQVKQTSGSTGRILVNGQSSPEFWAVKVSN